METFPECREPTSLRRLLTLAITIIIVIINLEISKLSTRRSRD